MDGNGNHCQELPRRTCYCIGDGNGIVNSSPGDVTQQQDGYPRYRVPCCCETLRGNDAYCVRRQHHCTCHGCSPYGQPWRHQCSPSRQRWCCTVENNARQPFRSSRMCFCCVPEREQLKDCELNEKRQRYLSVRAERENLRSSLIGDIGGSQSEPHKHYRSNMANLLRHARGAMFQQEAMFEQERRRQELLREVDARRRDLGGRGPYVMCGTLRDRQGGRAMPPTKGGVKPFEYTPVPRDGPRRLRRYSARVNTASIAREQAPCTRVEKRSAAPHVLGEEGTNQEPQVTKASAVKTTQPTKVAKTVTSRLKEKAVSKEPPRVVPCCCCCCHHAVCRCRHCNCFDPCRCSNTPSKEPVALPTSLPSKDATEGKEGLVGEKTVNVHTQCPMPEGKRSVATSRRSSPTSIRYGRKIYITDHDHLARRSGVIDHLEKDGFLRVVPPKTRSPSAPLSEITTKWETTRSTSAHLVCL
uniref:Uncharacterized protein n=1 Tax=Trypanosoma congolense (strain IL3000) TaxID=1068625 RepID=G0UYJ3_TRYCI|nr:conserved hypothetical protein [Trypanosoma congolense IL3000]